MYKKIMSLVEGELRSRDFKVFPWADDMLDFVGVVADSNGQTCEASGSIEIDPTLQFSYSVVFVSEDIETDGIIGSFSYSGNVSQDVDRIVVPNMPVVPIKK